jgi:nicotinate-nucleotide adenylyltransferase
LHDNYVENISELSKTNAGLINMQAISAHDISATQIREQLKHGQSVRYCLPNEVIEYIERYRLYQ